MSKKAKRPRPTSSYVKQVLAIIDRYETETSDKSGDLFLVASWAWRNGLIEPPHQDIVKQIARMMSRASRQDYFIDESGEPIRRRHNYREKRGDQQMTFWFKMEDATPQKMRLSANVRRNGTLMDMLQLVRDVSYFNRHHNPGDPILIDGNFNPDIEEYYQSGEYPDTPPDDDDDGSGAPVPA